MNVLLTSDASVLGNGAFWIVYIVIIFGFLYVVSVRPQKKEQKRVGAMLANMEIGDSVLTSSGFYGVLIDIQDDTVIVEFGSNKNCRIPMQKSAIVQVEKAGE
ncbi:MAG: preprotein translocase subunit YajC [Lachnospiraceae bacterium]